MREDPEPLWENSPLANDQQGLGYVYRRWNNAAAVCRKEREFETIRAKYGSGQTLLQIQMGTITTEEARTNIRNASRDATEWLDQLNGYYDYTPTQGESEGFQVFFQGDGFTRGRIYWENFKEMISTTM